MRRLPALVIFTVALALAGGLIHLWRSEAEIDSRRPIVLPSASRNSYADYEEWARAEFIRRHPGEKPLNWAMAEAAKYFYKTKPMGKFVLGLQPGEWGNDCSDFVNCAVDEGLGVRARFNRGSKHHLLAEDGRIWERFYWRRGLTVQPGDLLSIRHSPWYAPHDGSCGHVGIIGPDGMVYDFTKLRSWSHARYGRTRFGRFIRHSREPQQTIVWRLAARYRYKINPLPRPLYRS